MKHRSAFHTLFRKNSPTAQRGRVATSPCVSTPTFSHMGLFRFAVFRGVYDICPFLCSIISLSLQWKKNLFTFYPEHLFIQKDQNMVTVSLSNRLSPTITSVPPQADRIEKYSDSGSSPLQLTPRGYLIEASLRNFPKQCTKQSKQWKVTILKAMWC